MKFLYLFILTPHLRGVLANNCDEADFVVVGAGPAGCVMARRAAEEGYKVTLLERGGLAEASDDPVTVGGAETAFLSGDSRIPHNYVHLSLNGARPDLFDFFATGPAMNLPGAPSSVTAIGHTLGGGSRVNGMAWTKPSLDEFDIWPSNWGADAMEEAFSRVESTVSVESNSIPNPVAGALFGAAGALGIPTPPNYNDGVNEGLSYAQITRKDGKRHDAFTAYIDDAPDHIKNLITVHTGYEVSEVDIKMPAGKAEGVVAGGEYFCAKRGVVLAAGAVYSPVILERSGVGHPDVLESLGIDVKYANEEVGNGLQDHIGLLMTTVVADTSVVPGSPPNPYLDFVELASQAELYTASQQGLLAETGMLLLFSKENGATHTNFEAQLLTAQVQPSAIPDLAAQGLLDLPMFADCVDIDSRGSVHFSGFANQFPFPAFADPNYASFEAELECIAKGQQKLRELLITSRIGVGEIAFTFSGPQFISYAETGPFESSTDNLREQLAATAAAGLPFSVLHFTSSLQLDKVVDSETMEVFGVSDIGNGPAKNIKGLHVVDASLFPRIPRVNTMFPTYAVAERASKLILQNIG